ncbi:efflux RND transporter permease subunit [Tautonia plasticadhaerens]|uniref:Cation efflux system protein CusA n=1 Tax=Tautonia plasticadhaerens TaxID=2527974 RepID=A0A518H1M7_9BACT|nr:efflux RND transporter permease subunit [Tautonia plasticadhaerens]QDV34736.1 Cation efflux system protein CusA [Tautonia plasticadhaerens]
MSDPQRPAPANPAPRASALDRVIRFCLENKLVVALVVVAVTAWGAMVAPFDWDLGGLPRDPVPTDAIPDIGENQQIVFTEWMGRSPQDVEDQVTYPLTVNLLGIPGVKTIRSYSFFGFSSIYIILDEEIEFYWSRSRVLEKLNSLPAGTLPEGVRPTLGPDATALGQIFWYTLEGRDPDGNPAGGWDLNELRTVQDWYVRYGLQAAEGISEVASVGGFVQEYQIDVDPDAMRAYRVTLDEIFNAVRMSNVDVGARTIEVNKVEYVIRGLGFIESVADVERSVIKENENVPVRVGDVATVSLGPALRRGMLDKAGAEAVGGVAVVRYGYNPLEAIKNIKAKIEEIAPGLPTTVAVDFDRVDRATVEAFATGHGFEAFSGGGLDDDGWLPWLRANPRAAWPDWVTTSQVTVVPFYDRTGLIYETLGTLNTALVEEILVTIIVVIVMVMHLRSSFLISVLLPLAVLMCFIAMKAFGVDANVVALSGIAIAIGTMVDMGIIICENILKHLDEADPDEPRLEVIYRASSEVASAVLTAVSTTVISFLPVFTMIGAEGKLFRPLAFTKTFALIASVVVALTIIPPAAHLLFAGRVGSGRLRRLVSLGLVVAGGVVGASLAWWAGAILAGLGIYRLVEPALPGWSRRAAVYLANAAAVAVVGVVLARHWEPLGVEQGLGRNLAFVAALIGGLLGAFLLFQMVLYRPLLRWCLDHKLLFLTAPAAIVLLGGSAWLGFDRVFGAVPWAVGKAGGDPQGVRLSKPWVALSHAFPGLGREFMPRLDEGSFLWMPTTMPHASIGESADALRLQDMAINAIPEVDLVVGKIGRVDSPLDPAPISMVETVVSYVSEYISDESGHRINFRYDEDSGAFARDDRGGLIPDSEGRPFRQWRDHIRSPDDLWDEIVEAATIPGSTSAPKLQPIETRLVMLQTGMRAPMGLKVYGPDLETIERLAMEFERLLKRVPSVEPSAVIADRVVGKPYLEIDIDREAIARHGLMIRQVQDVIEVAIGGTRITTTVEGRERYPVRVRYLRELRDSIETLGRILVPAPDGTQIPLEQLAEIRYVRGPQAIKSEDTFLVAYVLLDKKPGFAEVDVVEDCQALIRGAIDSGELVLPAGASYRFSGSYENQIRAQKTLSVVLPLALFLIFLILYFQFKQVATSLLVFSGIVVAWAGGFLMLWAYGQDWFLDVVVFGVNLRDLFQVQAINLSVAVWVGFLALFGIASDDGVVIATYLDQSFGSARIETVEDARAATVEAGMRRVRPCLMTTATTILALIPVLTSTGRGSDIMVPMAIPSFGGMLIEVMTMLVVPVVYCGIKEVKIRAGLRDELFDEGAR